MLIYIKPALAIASAGFFMPNDSEIIRILRSLADQGKCVIIVTHSSYVASQADEIIKINRRS